MEALQGALALLRGLAPAEEAAALCGPLAQRMAAAFLKQSVERIARVREVRWGPTLIWFILFLSKHFVQVNFSEFYPEEVREYQLVAHLRPYR